MSPPPAGRILSVHKKNKRVNDALVNRLDAKKPIVKTTSRPLKTKHSIRPSRRLSDKQKERVGQILLNVGKLDNISAKRLIENEFSKIGLNYNAVISDPSIRINIKRRLRLIFNN